MTGESFEVYPEPCECGKGEWKQVGYDPNAGGAELIELECTHCGKLVSITGRRCWTAGRP
jgi:hypothetical protein